MNNSKEHSAIPQAVQILTASDQVQRQAKCPIHNKLGAYRAVQLALDGSSYWAFACDYLGLTKAHIFVAKPDRSAPKHVFEVEDWIAKQKQGRLQKMNSRGSA